MRSAVAIIICALFWSCSTITDSQTQNGFPNRILSAGSDNDYTFESIVTQRQKDGGLKVQITGWSIEEYGLFLYTRTENRILRLSIMGECGTVSTHTHVKKTFEYLVARAEEEALEQIHYGGFVITK
jgi:hypothetical protein